MKKNWKHILAGSVLLLAAALATGATASAQKDKQKNNPGEFDKVDYLFGPTARTTGDHVGGEVAKGILRFDGTAKILSFTTDKGPNLNIPYNRIQEFALDDKSLMRSGALAAGVVVAPFLRQHKHFLTIRYTDEKGANRTALLQLDKGNYQDVQKTVEREIVPPSGEAPKGAEHAEATAAPTTPSPSAVQAGNAEVKTGPKSEKGSHVILPVTGLKMRLPTGKEQWQAGVHQFDDGERDQLSRVKPGMPGMIMVNLRANPKFTDCKAFLSSAQAAAKSQPELLTSPNYLPADWPPFAVNYVPDFMVLACYPLPGRVLEVEIRSIAVKLSDPEAPASFAAILGAVAQAAKAK